jgi:hypothetical protein
MIIKLQRVMHRHGRWVFLFLLAVVIFAFILWDYAGWSNRMSYVLPNAMIYGQRINHRDLDVSKKLIQMHRDFMGRREVQLTERQDALLEEQILRRMALVEKARRLGIQATDMEVVEAIQQNPLFSYNGQFNQEAYTRFVTEILPGRGLSGASYEAMVREEVMVRKLLMTIASTARLTPQQLQAFANELAEGISVAYCRFDVSEFINSVKPTDDEVKAYFAAHGKRFQIPEKRKVAYVAFPIETSKVVVSDKDLQAAYEQNKPVFTQPDGKVKPFSEVAERLRTELQRRMAVQESGRRATDFTVKLVPEPGKDTVSFDALAKEAGLPVKESGFFSANDRVEGVSAPSFAAAAFRLSKDTNVSDPVEGADAVYVLSLVAQKPIEMPPFDAVKSEARSACVASAALKTARDRGEEKRRALEILLKEGKPFDKAIASLSLKAQTIPAFKMTDSMSKDYFEGIVRRVAVSLPVGGVSECIPQSTGSFFVVVTARKPATPEEVVQVQPQARMLLAQNQQEYVVEAFEKAVMDEAQLRLRRPIPPLPTGKTETPDSE